MAAFPRTISIIVGGKQIFATTFDEPLSESQRQWFEQEEVRVTRWIRLGIDTREREMTWQVVFLAMLPLLWGLLSLVVEMIVPA